MEQETIDTGAQQADAAGPVETNYQQPQAESHQESEMVPVSALQAERRERQSLQEKMRMLEDHVSLMQANQQKPQQPQQDEMAGLSDDDVLTVGEAKKFMQNIQQNYQMGIEELRVSQKYSDYQKVVKDYLPKVIEKNPALKNTLQNDPNRYELAYYLAKNSEDYRTSHKQTKKSEDAERIVQNAQRPGSLSAVGSSTPSSQPGGGFGRMSDDEFMKLANKHRGAW